MQSTKHTIIRLKCNHHFGEFGDVEMCAIGGVDEHWALLWGDSSLHIQTSCLHLQGQQPSVVTHA